MSWSYRRLCFHRQRKSLFLFLFFLNFILFLIYNIVLVLPNKSLFNNKAILGKKMGLRDRKRKKKVTIIFES